MRSVYLHAVTSVGLLLSITPLYAIVELLVIRMDPAVSLRARVFTALLVFLGLGVAYVALRGRSKRFFDIPDTVQANRAIVLHDLAFLVAFNGTLTPLLYLVSGARGLEVVYGTLFALGMAVFNGPMNGFMIDLCGDWSGLKPSGRLPAKLRNLEPVAKLLLFAILIVLVTALLVLLYSVAW